MSFFSYLCSLPPLPSLSFFLFFLPVPSIHEPFYPKPLTHNPCMFCSCDLRCFFFSGLFSDFEQNNTYCEPSAWVESGEGSISKALSCCCRCSVNVLLSLFKHNPLWYQNFQRDGCHLHLLMLIHLTRSSSYVPVHHLGLRWLPHLVKTCRNRGCEESRTVDARFSFGRSIGFILFGS